MQSTAGSLEPGSAPGRRRDEPSCVARHAVQFYEDDAFLAAAAADYLAAAAREGHAPLAIATAPHRADLLRGLRARGLDADGMCRDGRLTLLDARETLDAFMVDGLPDAERFGAVLGAALERAGRGRPDSTVCAFGEMVDMLWRDGNGAAAVRLEELWNGLLESRSCTLLCAYSMASFASAAHVVHFEEICRQHGRVVPTERYTLARGAARGAEISALQQRARALETELARRAELEERLRDALADKEALLERERAARAEAEAANRAKNDFLAIMSHELRTPLNAIAGYAELLALGVQGPVTPGQRASVERIQRSQRHLLGLIDEVLVYARTESGRVRYDSVPVPLGAVMREAELLLAPQMRAKGIEYEHAGCDGSVVARADAEKVQRIVLHVLGNALKFTPPGGRVRVEGSAEGEVVRVRVRDTGIGIAEGELEAVFQPFVQVDTRLARAHEGIGLGLAIARELARGMGGELAVESAPGHGSTFTLTLPRHRH